MDNATKGDPLATLCVVCGDPTEGDVVCSAACNDVHQQNDGGECPVCRSWVDIGGCCSKACYDLWNAPDDDVHGGHWTF